MALGPALGSPVRSGRTCARRGCGAGHVQAREIPARLSPDGRAFVADLCPRHQSELDRFLAGELEEKPTVPHESIARAQARTELVLLHLGRHPERSAGSIATALRINPKEASNALDALRRQRRVEKRGGLWVPVSATRLTADAAHDALEQLSSMLAAPMAEVVDRVRELLDRHRRLEESLQAVRSALST